MNTIHINEVLSILAIPDGRTHTLTFFRATGKKKGTKKRVVVRKGNSTDYTPNKSAIRKMIQLHIYNNSIPLVDVETGTRITPFISHFFSFNGKKLKF